MESSPDAFGLTVTFATLIMALIPGQEVLDHRIFFLTVFGSLAGNFLTGVTLYVIALWRRPKVLAGDREY